MISVWTGIVFFQFIRKSCLKVSSDCKLMQESFNQLNIYFHFLMPHFLTGSHFGGDFEEKVIIREPYLHHAHSVLWLEAGRPILQVSWKTLLLLNGFYVMKTGLQVLMVPTKLMWTMSSVKPKS